MLPVDTSSAIKMSFLFQLFTRLNDNSSHFQFMFLLFLNIRFIVFAEDKTSQTVDTTDSTPLELLEELAEMIEHLTLESALDQDESEFDDDPEITLSLWDFGGQSVFYTTHQVEIHLIYSHFFLYTCCVSLICCSYV